MSDKPSGILSFSKLITIMEKSAKNKKLFKEVGRDALLNIFKENITKKKLNAKDTVENRIKFQRIMLKGIKNRVVVPDQQPIKVSQILSQKMQ